MAHMYLCSFLLCAIAGGISAVKGEDLTSTGISVTRPDTYNVVAQKGNPLVLNCTVESNTSTSFTWYKNGQVLQLQNQRRVQVINGSLSFKRVLFRRKKNITDEGVYECHVRNVIGSIIAKRVKVKIAGIAKSYSEEPQPQDVPLGGVARFHCDITSTPPPIYMWQKDDQKQIRPGPRHIILPSGTLQILDVRDEDAGDYRCTATQGELHKLPDQVEKLPWKGSSAASLRVIPASGSREVAIVAAPPKVTSVEKGKSIVLECLAEGDPKPKVTWSRKGGEPVRNRHTEFVGDNLKLFDVDLHDSGVYVCSAESVGFPTKSVEAELRVISKPVVITKPKSYRYPKTRTSRFSCEFGGFPKPKVTWYFNGQAIKNGGKYNIIEAKNELVVTETELSDSGYYQCVGENTLGYDTVVARLNIYASEGAPDHPRNVTAFATDQNTINVYWNHSLSPSVPILAYTVEIEESNDQKAQRNIVVNGKTSATVDNLKAYTNYSIYIRGFSNWGAGPKSQVVTVRTHPDKPSQAPMIREASTTANSINIKWDELEEKYRRGVIISHLIEYMRVSDRKMFSHAVPGTARSYLISGLTPNTLYKIRVKAGTVVGYPDLPGDSQWVEYRTAGNTNASANNTTPSPPSDVSIKKISTSTVNVTWQHTAGDVPVTSFTLSVTRLKGTSQVLQTYQIVDPTTTWFRVTGLENMTSYQFSLVANSQQGSSSPIDKEYATSEEPLLEAPLNLRVVNRTSTAIQLVWAPLRDTRGEVVEYEVRYHPLMFMKDEAHNKEIVVKTSQSTLWITSLKPYTSYQCDVRAVVGGVTGRWSLPVINLTQEGVPSEPRELQGQVRKGEIFITWKPPARPNGNITTYLVMYQILTSSDVISQWEIKSVNGTLTSATIEQLQNGLYRIKLKACTNAGPGPPTDPIKISDVKIPGPQKDPSPQENQKLGIILGVSIGVVCIIICVFIIVCRNKCLAAPQSHITQPAYLHTNGHAGGRGNGHALGAGLNEYQLETCTPMLSSLPGENEHSDSKGCGSGNIIVTPNGSRVNGYVPFKNGMKNGHISNGYMSTFVGYANSGNLEERRGLIAAMLSGSDVSHIAEEQTPLGKAPDRDSLLDDIDKSLEDTEESNKSLNDQDGSIQNLPPNMPDDMQQVCCDVSQQSTDSFQNTSKCTAAAKTGQRRESNPPHSSLRGFHREPATSQESDEGGMVPSHSSNPHNLHQGRQHGNMADEGQNDQQSLADGKLWDLPDCQTSPLRSPPVINHSKPTSSQEIVRTGHKRDAKRGSQGASRGVKGTPRNGGRRRSADVSV